MLNSQEMINRFRQLIFGSLLIKGSLVVLIGAAMANFGAYLFHLVMARLLGVTEYGVLESLVSLLYFINVPISALSLVTVKFISQEKEEEKMARFVKKATQFFLIWGLIGLALFAFVCPIIKKVIHVNSFLQVFAVGLGGYFSIFLTISSSSLQGLAKFLKLSLVAIFGSWLKLVVAAALVLAGFGVVGAVYGMVLATLLSACLGYRFLVQLLPFRNGGKINIRKSFGQIGSYSLAVLGVNLSLTSFYTLDIILARYFLSPVEAGYYAALSVLGKIIFFASSPISQVMFPLVSGKKARGEDYKKLLGLSLLLVTLISLFSIVAYSTFSEVIIGLMFGLEKYQAIVPHLGRFAIFISLYCLCFLLANFYLSIAKTIVVVIPALIALLQLVIILVWHESIAQIVSANIFSMVLLLVSLLFLYWRTERIKIKVTLPFDSQKI